MANFFRSIVGALALLTIASICLADPFTPGNLVVYRIGDGSSTPGPGAPLFLNEYTTGGTLIQSLAMPTNYGSSPMTYPLLSGSLGVGGLLSRSQDGQFLIVPGLTGSSLYANSTGIVDANGNITTTTAMTNVNT